MTFQDTRRQGIDRIVGVAAGALGLLVIWGIIGSIVLGVSNNNIQGKIGDVWTTVDRANELLPRLEGQLNYTTTSQKEAIDRITAARNALLAAKATGDLQAAFNAVQHSQPAMHFVVEHYPDFGLPVAQKTLAEETAGSVNRIAYARHKLIQDQVSFNNKRLVFVPAGLFYGPQHILGSEHSPKERVTPDTLNNP
jgi:LemA protein